MKRFHFIRCFVIVLCLLLAVAGVFAQADPCAEFKTSSSQGKDVVWVPTPQGLVDTMLNIAKVTPSDYVIDLGSGDGRTVISAAKRGATALGIEYNPERVALSKCLAAHEGVSAKATFIEADFFETDFSKATVLTMFLLPNLNMRLRPQILDMKPGTRIATNAFTMEDWKWDHATTLTENCAGWCNAYLWIVPAKVDGTWKLDNGQIKFNQEFQFITGTLTMNGKDQAIDGKLDGEKISFTAGGTEYTGTVSGNTISGTRAGGGSWKATR
jgi:hypothetical protein